MESSFKYTEIPPFTKRDGEALLFDQDGWLEYYIPEEYFTSSKSSAAIIEGAYIKLIGSFNYRIYNDKGVAGKLMTFNYPTVFICKPSRIDKKKDITIDEGLDPGDYRIFRFEKGDQLVTRVHIEKNVDNLGLLLRLHVKMGKFPNNIPYNELYKYPYEGMALNSGSYNVHSQAMGLLYSKNCTDPKDVSTLFRLSKAADKSMIGYKTISMKEAAKYISPFASLTSENLDESIMSATLLTEDEKNGKKHVESPLERVLMM
jgi:hypothetical protein